MRESVFFELRLRRFGVWQGAVWLVAGAAIAAVAAWALTMFDSEQSGRALVIAVAAGLSLATIHLDKGSREGLADPVDRDPQVVPTPG